MSTTILEFAFHQLKGEDGSKWDGIELNPRIEGGKKFPNQFILSKNWAEIVIIQKIGVNRGLTHYEIGCLDKDGHLTQLLSGHKSFKIDLDSVKAGLGVAQVELLAQK